MKLNYGRIKTWIKYAKTIPEENYSWEWRKSPSSFGTTPLLDKVTRQSRLCVAGWAFHIPEFVSLGIQSCRSIDSPQRIIDYFFQIDSAKQIHLDVITDPKDYKKKYIKNLRKLLPWYHRIQTYL